MPAAAFILPCFTKTEHLYHTFPTCMANMLLMKNEPPLHPCPKPIVFKVPDIEEKLSEADADYIPLELDNLDDSKRDADQSTLLGAVRLHSTLKSSMKLEDPITNRLNGKHSKHDCYHSHLLNESIISECGSQMSVIDHIVKESKSSLQNMRCKPKHQPDERSDVLSPRRGCSGGQEVSATSGRKNSSDKSSRLPAFSDNRGRIMEERNDKNRFSPQDIQSKEMDVSGKRRKLMSLSFAERLRNQLAQSCFRNGESPVAQAGQVGMHTSHR